MVPDGLCDDPEDGFWQGRSCVSGLVRADGRLEFDGLFPALEQRAACSPVLAAAQVEFREPVPIGIDTASAPVTCALAGSSLLIGGAVGSGVSCAAQHVAAAAVLDPAVRLSVFDGYPFGADWACFRPLAADFTMGSGPEQVDTVREALGGLAAELDARLGRAPAQFGQRLVLVANAERYTTDRHHGAEITCLLAKIVHLGPFGGLALVLTTHRPYEVLQGGLGCGIGHRLALHAGRSSSAAILGAGLEQRLGVYACELRKPGTGILASGGTASLVHCYHLGSRDLATACRTAALARGLEDQ